MAQPRSQSVTENLDIGPFAPPYVLAGSAFVVVGSWQAAATRTLLDGHGPLRVLGRDLGVIVGTSYEEPPRELPIRYHEVIAAVVVRRGLSLMSLPFDMVLDQPIPVDLGRIHYGLPKRFDPTMQFRNDDSEISVSGADTTISASARDAFPRALSLPARVAFGLGVRLLTRRIDVLGAFDGAARRARISLAPRGVGRSLGRVSAVVGGRSLDAMWCQSWAFTSTWLGPPRAL